jgi:ATP-dependent helicase/nuclease subunit B
LFRLFTEIDDVLEQGGTVVVPSRQRAHAVRLAYAAAQLSRGRRVWSTPDILPVEAWLTREIERYAATVGTDVPRLLSPAEEWFLWRQCAAEATGELELVNRGALAEALRRASAIAADFGIDIRNAARPDPDPTTDPAGLYGALGTETVLLAEVQRAVDERCRSLGAATVASLVGRLSTAGQGRKSGRVVASGFLTVPPRLRSHVLPLEEGGRESPVVPHAVIATDELDELERIAQWCKTQLERKPDARILIMLPGAPGARERLATLIRQAVDPRGWLGGPTSPDARPRADAPLRAPMDGLVVIEGGAPLARVPAVAHALATLSWLGGNPGDFEAVSGWLRAPYWQAPGPVPRARVDLWLRERERMHFHLHDLVVALSAVPATLASEAREISAQINKAAIALGQGAASPRDWSERFRAALGVFGWPGERTRSSGEQQTIVRFHELLDEFGQLASAARSISRDNAIQWFTELASRTAFRPADDDAVVTISSVLADPVVRYDAIWIAGLHVEAFPQPVQPDAFLPLAAQLAAGVPAASASGRLAEARALVSAWRASADELVLSAPARAEDLELLPSPLLAEWLPEGRASSSMHAQEAAKARTHGDPLQHPTLAASSLWLPVRIHREGLLEVFEDAVGVRWPVERALPSGTRSLELQNQCPFRAYAELRLGSTPLEAPEPGIAADLRGQLLHAALQNLWVRLRDSKGLAALSDAALDAAIHESVEEAANQTQRHAPRAPPAASNDAQGDLFEDPQHSPALSRECRRAKRLIRTLCEVERERAPFRVESAELESTLTLMGALLRVRIDRVDALESGGRAILDYKSGRRTTADWYGERPSHPQLLAYMAALGDDVVAMATVNVTAREVRFDGIANSSELLPKVKAVEAALGTDPIEAWSTRREEWLARVEHLAAAFLAGQAAVDPKPGACDYCHVASVCRISDRLDAELM